MQPITCPDRQTLEKLLLGDLPAAEHEALSEHLLHCDECVAVAETLSIGDELTEALRTRRRLGRRSIRHSASHRPWQTTSRDERDVGSRRDDRRTGGAASGRCSTQLRRGNYLPGPRRTAGRTGPTRWLSGAGGIGRRRHGDRLSRRRSATPAASCLEGDEASRGDQPLGQRPLPARSAGHGCDRAR